MIKINKPSTPPHKLIELGQDETERMKRVYDEVPEKYNSGEKKFDFDSDVYGHKDVKEKLKEIQHHKCCFCESKVDHISYGDIEHFRPKKGFRQRKNDRLGRPGYYWLAYEWDNLLFACQLCNQRYKRNYFPLENDDQRAVNHHADQNVEVPVLINPAQEDSELYITFERELPVARNNNKRGKVTIRELGLDRDELNELRRTYYDDMEFYYDAVLFKEFIPQYLYERARSRLEEAQKDTSQYAAMIRAAVESGFE